MKLKFNILYIIILSLFMNGASQNLSKSRFTIGRIHYKGGGDWYGNKTSLKNMLANFSAVSGLPVQDREIVVELDEPHFFSLPVLYIAGHGNIHFEPTEVNNLRRYLSGGGFLFADDDYGMDKYFRREMKKVFPELEFVDIPFSDPVFKTPYKFPNGLPKIHEHDGGTPEIYGIYLDKRLVCIYTKNTDISDGCEDRGIHNDSPDVRKSALKFSANVLNRALTP